MNWWQELYEKRFKDASYWSIPEDGYVKSQVDYCLKATGLRKGAYIMDLGAGTGRHIAYFKKLGFPVKGLEYSKAIVTKGVELTPGLDLLEGDMRNLGDIDKYDGVTFFDTAFGIFDDITNQSLLNKVYKALKPDGWVAIDYMNYSFWKTKRDKFVIEDYKKVGDKFLRQYFYDEKTYRIIDRGEYIFPDGKVEVYPEQTLAIYPEEIMRTFLEKAGFGNISFYGTSEYNYPDELISVSSEGAFLLAVGQKV